MPTWLWKLSAAGTAALSIAILGGFIAPAPAMASEIFYEFSAQPGGARAWLASQGFGIRMAMGNPSQARIGLDDRGLLVETLGPSEPVISRANIAVAQPAQLAITWGVNRYPAGANWDAGVNNEAVMVIVFFGAETFPGGFFVPPSPYFVGFFLCDRGRRGELIAGRSYRMQGRYVCLDGPPPGKEVTSTVALDEAFRAAFPGRRVPQVTGFAIEADTTQVGQGARSSAWVKSIRIGAN